MGTAEQRRDAILITLYRRQHETIANLAFEFGVSYSTIRRDIDILSFDAPLVMKSGRYSGGVYIADFDRKDCPVTAEDELLVLHKLSVMAKNESVCLLSDKETKALNSIIAKYMSRQKQNI